MTRSDHIENCNLCGMCNLSSPIYRTLLKESAGPRFKVFLAKKKEYKKVFYLSNLATINIEDCPADIKLDIREIRAEMIKQGNTTPENEKMRKNIIEHGNPFGKLTKGEKIKQYYT
jgi:Fe-S oxidoreductase